jgi:hypothetical protein
MPTSTLQNTATSTPTFWIKWLSYTAEFTVLFGFFMVLAPGLTQQAFGLLVFQNPRTNFRLRLTSDGLHRACACSDGLGDGGLGRAHVYAGAQTEY